MGLKSLVKLFGFVVCNPYQSSPSLTILVPLWFIIISLVFFYLCKVLFSGFLQFKGKFVDGQNSTSKYRDRAPLTTSKWRSTNTTSYLQSTEWHGAKVYSRSSSALHSDEAIGIFFKKFACNTEVEP